MDQIEQKAIQKITQVYNNVQEFVDACAEWDRAYDERAKREETCDPLRFPSWLCCPKHLLLSAEKDTLDNWARYYGQMHRVYEGKNGFIMSRNWLTELAKNSGCILPEVLR